MEGLNQSTTSGGGGREEGGGKDVFWNDTM